MYRGSVGCSASALALFGGQAPGTKLQWPIPEKRDKVAYELQ